MAMKFSTLNLSPPPLIFGSPHLISPSPPLNHLHLLHPSPFQALKIIHEGSKLKELQGSFVQVFITIFSLHLCTRFIPSFKLVVVVFAEEIWVTSTEDALL
ncbi:hypothetical protein Hanom_Chr05g00395141 [Helianthus anomalus]